MSTPRAAFERSLPGGRAAGSNRLARSEAWHAGRRSQRDRRGSAVALFWVALASGLAWAVRLRDPARARQHLCAATSTLPALLVAGYLVTFGVTRLNPAAWWITVGLCAIAVALAGVARAARVSPSDVEREPIDQAVA